MEVESKRITIPIDGKRGTYLLEEWRIGIHGRNSKRFFLRFKNHFLIYKKRSNLNKIHCMDWGLNWEYTETLVIRLIIKTRLRICHILPHPCKEKDGRGSIYSKNPCSYLLFFHNQRRSNHLNFSWTVRDK